MKETIQVKNLSYCYGNFQALSNVSFSVVEGERFGIIGENGAGKTTTVECIAGIRKKYNGSIHVLGEEISSCRRDFYNKLSIQPQSASFPEKLKVKEILRLFSSFYSSPLPYDELLQVFNIASKNNCYYGSLSGGQKQQLSIIVAMLSNAEVLLLDELTTGLDPQTRLKTINVVKKYTEGKTVVMTTHYLNEIEQLCDRVCILKRGCVVGCGSLEELYRVNGIGHKIIVTTRNHDAARVLQSFLPDYFLFSSGIQLNLFSNNPDIKNHVEKLLQDNGISYTEIEEKHPSADDLYYKLFDVHCDTI